MRAEIVAVGTELLLGDIVNGNAAWLGHELAAIGVDVEQTTAVGDNIARIAAVLATACARCEVVIVTGGLGPTQDDVTREALAHLTGQPLVRDAELEAALVARFEAMGRADFARNNLRMADRPYAAVALDNSAGTAPGIRIEHGGAVIFALPGVPTEMREIFAASVRADVARLTVRGGGGAVLVSRQLRTVGLWESEIAERLADIDAELDATRNPTLAYLASHGQTTVRITAKAPSRDVADAMIAAVEARVRVALGDAVFGVGDDTLASVVHSVLVRAGATVATAESLTGGLLGAAMTSVPGSSLTYRGGIVGYVSEAKQELLGVSQELLAARGAVDPDVALAMAAGCRERFGATYGIATTGAAGPTEQDGKPVGTVFVAVVGPGDDDDPGRQFVRELHIPGDRERVRQATVTAAVDLLRLTLRRLGHHPPS